MVMVTAKADPAKKPKKPAFEIRDRKARRLEETLGNHSFNHLMPFYSPI